MANSKGLIPYCTHEGSGKGGSECDIKRLCPNAKILPGLAILGGSVDMADKDVETWLTRLNLIAYIGGSYESIISKWKPSQKWVHIYGIGGGCCNIEHRGD